MVIEKAISERIAAWLPHTNMTADEVGRRIEAGTLLMIALPDESDGIRACAGLELTDDSVHVTMVSGENMRAWLPELVETVEQLARSQGRRRITSRGRRGWDRVLAPYGFVREGLELNKELGHGLQ